MTMSTKARMAAVDAIRSRIADWEDRINTTRGGRRPSPAMRADLQKQVALLREAIAEIMRQPS